MILCLLIALTIIVFLNVFPKFFLSNYTINKYKNDVVAEKLDLENISFQNIPTDSTKDNYCEVIHVGLVCAGSNSILYFHTLLKSLYFYRVNPLHFHIITNKASQHVLDTLFSTWKVPQVQVSFYDMAENIKEVRWIPTSHYSGVHGLLKLLFPKVITKDITSKIIIIDTDITVVSDIYELWKQFEEFNKSHAVGIVENQSEYYLGSNTWPAIHKGFNTGVMLLELHVLRQIDWTKIWRRIAKRDTLIYGSTRLADQDIINAVLKENPHLLFKVPCVWNTQLSDRTLSYNCYEKQKPKIIHWNSPKKYNVDNKDGEYFRNVAMGFMEYNGNLFRKKLHSCNGLNVPSISDSTELCSEFYNLHNNTWRILLFFMEFHHEVVENDITLVAHLSYDRLYTIEDLVKSWTGPLSLTIYLSDPELVKAVNFLTNSEILKSRKNVAYHAVFREGDLYPINTLRNIGLRNIHTKYAFLADIDFMPSRDLYNFLRNHVTKIGLLKKQALVVPAFEVQSYAISIPKNKEELLQCLNNKTAMPFLSKVWPSGHLPTDYDRWKTALEPYQVKWAPDYEPYIVVSRDVPEYNENFVGFGWNKVSHIMELEAQNYEFLVLPDVFIVHKPHGPSYDIARFRSSMVYRLCLQMLKEDFIQKLNKKYNKSFEYTNSSVTIAYMNMKRRKRNYDSSDGYTTLATNTDYPFNTE